jgi:predicted permease
MNFIADVRLGLRQLFQQPAFTAVAILSLGIGLNTTLFSVVNAVLLRDNPFADPHRLVEIYTGLSKDFPQLTTSYPDFVDIRDGAPAIQGLVANAYVRGILSTSGRPMLVTGEAVTSNYFDVLGTGLTLGRAFRPDENVVPDAAPVAVLSYGLWQRQFGARTTVIGETMRLSGLDYTIIGVGPRRFSGTLPGIPTDFWVPLMMVNRLEFSGVQASTGNDPGTTRFDRRGTRWLFLKGRLVQGQTVEAARAQIETIFARNSTSYPLTNKDVTTTVLAASSVRFHPMLDGYIRAASTGLLAAVSLVLLVACANVANLLLVRGRARRRELAIREALGATRRRITQQLVTEALLLAMIGGALGLGIAWWAGRLLSGVGTNVFPMPISFDFSIDATVLLFAVAASFATAALFGLAPAWASSKLNLVPALKELAEGDRARTLTVRDALVVGQLAVSVVLLVTGALLTRAFIKANNADLGYDPTPIASLSFDLQMNGYDVARATTLRREAERALRALPGVVAVSTATRLPLAPDINMKGILVAGHHAPTDEGDPIDYAAVGIDYFQAVNVPIVDGRGFTEVDLTQHRKVVVINETMARRYWPNRRAVGGLIYSGAFDAEPYEVIGVVRDHKVRSVGEDPRPYLHFPDQPERQIGFVVRMATPAASALPMLRDVLWKLEPDIVFTEDAPAEQIAQTTVAPTRIGAMILGAFGLLALLLATIGLYGVIAYSVSRRTREMGIRIAVGAQRQQVLRMVLTQGLRLAAVGVVMGALLSAAIGSVLESLLFGVSRFDPIAYAIVALMLLATAAAANVIPALVAARVDPVKALRSE